MIDPLTGSCLQLRLQPAVSISGMLQDHLAQPILQCLLIRINDAIPLLMIMSGTFGQGERFTTTIETVLATVVPNQRYLLVHRQRSPKRFFSRAISTSFLISLRSSSDTYFSYNLISSLPPNTSDPCLSKSFLHSLTFHDPAHIIGSNDLHKGLVERKRLHHQLELGYAASTYLLSALALVATTLPPHREP